MSSEPVPGGSSIGPPSLLTQLCDITDMDQKEAQLCDITDMDQKEAHTLLLKTNYDLNRAVNLFFSDKQDIEVIEVGSDTDDEGRKRPGKDINSNDRKKIKIDNSDYLKADIEDVNINAVKSLIPNETTEVNKALNDPTEGKKYNEEEMLKKALEESEIEFRAKEPNASETFKILSQNYPQYDPSAVQDLCNDYAGRSAELEKFVQLYIYTLPTKLEAEKSKLKSQLEDLAAAGVDEANDMVVEDCPSCKKPQIVEDPSAKIFICQNAPCREESCRKCKKAQHFPDECEDKPNLEHQDSLVNLWDKTLNFEIINMKPKRSFDKSDDLDKEFRLAEGQFLRFNESSAKKYKIQSIDLVRNKKLEEKFEAKKEELKKNWKEECLLLFHGTPQKNIQPILQNNFDIGIIANGRALGNGVYFSECPEVLTGNNTREVKIPGINKKNANDERCWAIVVPDVDQILPRYVINFT